MGRHKDFRKLHSITKKNDKKAVKVSSGLQTSFDIKNIERFIDEEIELAHGRKKLDKVSRKELERFPLLAKAVYLGCERAVDELLEAAENVNVQTPDGSTPLMIAVDKGHTTILHKLLRKGADMRITRKNGMNALMIAVSKNEDKAFSLLWSHLNKTGIWQLNQADSEGYTLLTTAVERGNFDYTKFFLGLNGLEVDRQTNDGMSALMLAARRSHKGIVQCLLDSGANVLLEDRFGATALCFAFAQEQMEIADVLQRDLSSKDRDVYVKKRVELLCKPRHINPRHETVSFYKRVLFRVLLKIKEAVSGGVQLLLRHRVFAALVRCADSHQGDANLRRLVFHLCVCLMYDEDAATLVLEEMAAHFVGARGPDYCVRSLLQMDGFERWSALLPVHASCVGCPAGRQWLRENCSRILEHTAGFREAMPDLKYWTNSEPARAELVLNRFEEAVARLVSEPGEEDLADRATGSSNDIEGGSLATLTMWDEGEKETEPDEDSNCPSYGSSVDILRKKKKIDLRRKLRNIKFHAKSYEQHKVTDLSRTTNWTLKPDFKLCPAGCSSASSSLNSYTGYADALKRNLNSEFEDESQSSECTAMQWDLNPAPMLTLEKDINLTKNRLEPMYLNSNGILHSEHVTVRESGIHQGFLDLSTSSEDTSDENNIALKKIISPNSLGKNSFFKLASTLRDGYDFWSQVPIQAETSHCTALNNLCISQNSIVSNRENEHFEHVQPDVESATDLTDRKRCKQSENAISSCGTMSSLGGPSAERDDLGGPSAERDTGFQDMKLIADYEENLCLKFNNLVLEDELGSEDKSAETWAKMNKKKEVNSEKKKCRKSVISRFLNQAGSEITDLNLSKVSDERSGLKQDEAQIVSSENCNESKRTYCDVARGEIKHEKRAIVGEKASLEHICSEITKNDGSVQRRRYSDVTRVKLKQAAGIADCYVQNIGNEIQNNLTKDVFEQKKPRGIYASSRGKDSMVKTYLEPVKNKASKSGIDQAREFVFIMDSSSYKTVANLSESILSQPIHIGDFHKFINRHSLAVGDVLRNLSKKQNVQQETTRSSSLLSVDGKFFITTKDFEAVADTTSQKPWKDDQKSISTLNRIFQNKRSKKYSIEAVRQKVLLLENVEVPPIIYKLKLGALKMYASLYHQFISYESNICLPETTTIHNRATLSLDFEKTLLLKHGSSRKHKVTSFKSNPEVEKKDAYSIAKADKRFIEDVNKFEFLNNLLKNLTIKTLKSGESPKKKVQNLTPKKSIEYKRQISKEETVIKRRIRIPGKILENECNRWKEEESRYVDIGYVPRLVLCQSDSKWYPILKGIQSCVPLSQHLLPPAEITGCRKLTHLRSINSKIGKVIFSTKLEHILREGDFGSYVGIVEDGNPVVVRQLSTSTIFKDITALFLSRKHLLKHKNLTVFYDAQINLKDLKMSFIYELCEHSLPQYLEMCDPSERRTMASPTFFRKLLIIDLLEGIRYLHDMEVVHGFLKPSNLMVTLDHRLKITDYHLLDIKPLTWGTRLVDPKQRPIGSSMSKYCWRPTELIKAENATDARKNLSAASDIQMCGMVIFYLLSSGKHPFGSSDHTCQENIKLGTRLMGPHPEDTESRDLICEMIKGESAERPPIEIVQKHPYFWDLEKRFRFLLQVGNKISFYISRPNRAADDFRKSCIEARNWLPYVQRNLMKYISKCTDRTFRNEFSDLLQFAVALQDYYEAMPYCLKSFVHLPSHYILSRFPTTFMSVYYVVRCSPILIIQMGLQDFF